MKNGNEYPHIAGLSYLLYLLTLAPLFCLSVYSVKVEAEVVLQGISTDAPSDYFFVAMMAVVGPICLVFLVASAVVSVFVWLRGGHALRRRIVWWYAVLLVILVAVIYGPQGPQFPHPSGLYLALYETLLMLPLMVLPLFWLWRDRRYYIAGRARRYCYPSQHP